MANILTFLNFLKNIEKRKPEKIVKNKDIRSYYFIKYRDEIIKYIERFIFISETKVDDILKKAKLEETDNNDLTEKTLDEYYEIIEDVANRTLLIKSGQSDEEEYPEIDIGFEFKSEYKQNELLNKNKELFERRVIYKIFLMIYESYAQDYLLATEMFLNIDGVFDDFMKFKNGVGDYAEKKEISIEFNYFSGFSSISKPIPVSNFIKDPKLDNYFKKINMVNSYYQRVRGDNYCFPRAVFFSFVFQNLGKKINLNYESLRSYLYENDEVTPKENYKRAIESINKNWTSRIKGFNSHENKIDLLISYYEKLVNILEVYNNIEEFNKLMNVFNENYETVDLQIMDALKLMMFIEIVDIHNIYKKGGYDEDKMKRAIEIYLLAFSDEPINKQIDEFKKDPFDIYILYVTNMIGDKRGTATNETLVLATALNCNITLVSVKDILRGLYEQDYLGTYIYSPYRGNAKNEDCNLITYNSGHYDMLVYKQ